MDAESPVRIWSPVLELGEEGRTESTSRGVDGGQGTDQPRGSHAVLVRDHGL